VFPLKDNIPTDRFPVLTVAFIVLNVLAYVLLQEGRLGLPEGGLGGALTVPEYAAVPCEVTGADPCRLEDLPGRAPVLATLFTSMFMHGGLLHLGGNMLFLWIFGNNVEDAMGRVRFVAFYLLGGLAAIAAQIAVDPGSEVPTIGASGAVAAVLGGYILLYPRARVVTIIFIVFFFTLIELPAMVVLGLWFGLQLAYGAADLANPTGGGGGVAYFAHIGGFAFGLLAIKLFAQRRKDYSPPPKYPVY
jgi:membrane associated rhomboid family serine protease